MVASSEAAVSAPASGESMTNSSQAMMQQSSAPAMMRQSEPAAGMMKSSSAKARVVSIVASNFAFTPNAITVKKGEKVTLRITSTEGIHGFGIPDMGVNERIAPGDTIDITLDTSIAGTFAFRCTVPCGPGHEEMTGTITIE